jgi:hypothetical protein
MNRFMVIKDALTRKGVVQHLSYERSYGLPDEANFSALVTCVFWV